MIAKLLPLVRTVAFGAVCLFSVIIFSLSVHIVSITRGYYPFAALSLATSILSLLTLPASYIISSKRRGAITSFVAVEIVWLWLLWILWISGAGSTVALPWLNYYTGGAYSEARAIAAFSFLNWLIITFYTLALLTLSIRSHLRGYTYVWRSEVNHFDWSAPAANSGFNKGGVAGPEQNFTGTTVHSENTYQSQYPVGNVSNVGPHVLSQQYPPQQPQYPPPQQQQAFVGAPRRMPQSPQV
ncbi:hypothetical protein H1R20_g12253, partial [Candolleomyces eurysporus]